MNRFFRILLRFSLCPVIVFAALCVVTRIYFYYTFRDAVAASQNVSTVILGDSHPQKALIADSIDQSFNFSFSSERHANDYKKLGILSEKDSLRLVIVGVSYHSFASSHEQHTPAYCYKYCFTFYPFIREMPYRCYWELSDRATMIEVILCHELGFLSRNSLPMMKQELMGIPLLYSHSEQIAPLPVDWASKIAAHYYEGYDADVLRTPDFSFIEALCDIQSFCRERDCKLVLFNAPVSSGYYAHIPPFYKHLTDSVVNALVDNRTTFYFDYTRYPLPDSCYADGDHLNRYGADIITPLLRDSLRSLGLLDRL
ncbi:MAG: hypothetical protein LBB27_02225 [Tannerellaceae bacterium]|jgi:hypothetical protein|nr:hypothetical protein [Tannerellaceae bacterium]